MTFDHYKPNWTALLALFLPATGYLVGQLYVPHGPEMDWLDGSIGLVLGLYICSRPAANGIDLFFAERGAWRRIFTRRSGFEWMVLNALLMFAGWLVLVTGAARFSMGRSPFLAFP